MLHDQADGIPGLVIERLGAALIVQVHEERLACSEVAVRQAASFFHERLGTRAVYRKFFVKDRARPTPAQDDEHRNPQPWMGVPLDPAIPIHEQGLRYLVHPYDGYSTGLFLEHRDNRRRIHDLARGRRVLNTFAYTCGFSVAAAAGGAASVDSVDLSKRYLEWGKANFAENGLELANHRFFCSDVQEFYGRAARQGRRYDVIILDPPTFARLPKPHPPFVLDKQLDALVAGAITLLEPGGRILVSTNQRTMTPRQLEYALKAVRERTMGVEFLPLPCDFGGDAAYTKAVLATERR